MDISSHQQSVDWEAVKAAGVDFAICAATAGIPRAPFRGRDVSDDPQVRRPRG